MAYYSIGWGVPLDFATYEKGFPLLTYWHFSKHIGASVWLLECVCQHLEGTSCLGKDGEKGLSYFAMLEQSSFTSLRWTINSLVKTSSIVIVTTVA